MTKPAPQFDVRFAATSADVLAAQRLRYDVFCLELKATGPTVDHSKAIESDRFDPFADHLILRDLTRAPEAQVIGTCRIMNAAQAADAKAFSCDSEYDLTALQKTGRPLLELGRSCVHPDYRGGMALFHIWQALAAHIEKHQIEILFGVASFHGADAGQHAQALTFLAREHQSPFHVPSRAPVQVSSTEMNRKDALRATPALIKAYLRLGGAIGQGAFVDRDMNTTDVCMILDVTQMDARQRAIYRR